MASVRNELEKLSSDLDGLVSIAEEQTSVSDDLLSRIDNLHGEVNYATEHCMDVTEDTVEQIKYEFSLLQSDLARAIGIAGILHHRGQLKQADAIEELGHDQIIGAILGGIFGMIGSAIVGLLIERGLETGADKVANAINQQSETLSEEQLKQMALLVLISKLQETRPYLTFKYIVDVASSENKGFFTPEEARMYLSSLIAVGILEKYHYGKFNALKLNQKHPAVEKLSMSLK